MSTWFYVNGGRGAKPPFPHTPFSPNSHLAPRTSHLATLMLLILCWSEQNFVLFLLEITFDRKDIAVISSKILGSLIVSVEDGEPKKTKDFSLELLSRQKHWIGQNEIRICICKKLFSLINPHLTLVSHVSPKAHLIFWRQLGLLVMKFDLIKFHHRDHFNLSYSMSNFWLLNLLLISSQLYKRLFLRDLFDGDLIVKRSSLLCSLLINPILEEILFKKVVGSILSPVTTALLFSSMHLFMCVLSGLGVFQLVLTFLFCLISQKTSSLWVSIIFHIYLNVGNFLGNIVISQWSRPNHALIRSRSQSWSDQPMQSDLMVNNHHKVVNYWKMCLLLKFVELQRTWKRTIKCGQVPQINWLISFQKLLFGLFIKSTFDKKYIVVIPTILNWLTFLFRMRKKELFVEFPRGCAVVAKIDQRTKMTCQCVDDQ